MAKSNLTLTKQQKDYAQLKADSYGKKVYVYEDYKKQVHFIYKEPTIHNATKGFIIFTPSLDSAK